ncbi:neuroguidin isoform X1 [Tanacetum coccineum]
MKSTRISGEGEKDAAKDFDTMLRNASPKVEEQNKKVLGSRSAAKKVQLKAETLKDRSIVEMKTGEGKTLPLTLASYLNALAGESVHGLRMMSRLSLKNDMPLRDKEVIGIEDREVTRYKAKLEDRARREEELFTRAPLSSVENKKLKHMHKSRFWNFIRDTIFDLSDKSSEFDLRRV